MNKELEALERLYKCNDDDYTLGYQQHDYKLLQEALQRLEAIDNAKPSEALEKLLDGYSKGMAGRSYYDTIKQALLKAQEQEKVLEIIKEKRIDIESFYITFIEDEFDYNHYEKYYGTYGLECLTQEEFDLLKRWLG